jgi:hypothetical protein
LAQNINRKPGGQGTSRVFDHNEYLHAWTKLCQMKPAELYFTCSNDLQLGQLKPVSPSSFETSRVRSPTKYPSNYSQFQEISSLFRLRSDTAWYARKKTSDRTKPDE